VRGDGLGQQELGGGPAPRHPPATASLRRARLRL
jgi:hypothetical protein